MYVYIQKFLNREAAYSIHIVQSYFLNAEHILEIAARSTAAAHTERPGMRECHDRRGNAEIGQPVGSHPQVLRAKCPKYVRWPDQRLVTSTPHLQRI